MMRVFQPISRLCQLPAGLGVRRLVHASVAERSSSFLMRVTLTTTCARNTRHGCALANWTWTLSSASVEMNAFGRLDAATVLTIVPMDLMSSIARHLGALQQSCTTRSA